MRKLSFFLTMMAVLSLAAGAQAQRRYVSHTALQPQVIAEIPLAGDDYVFGALGLLRDGYSTSYFSGARLRAGYEHFQNQHWSLGTTLDVKVDPLWSIGEVSTEYTQLTPEVFARHWGLLGQFNFRQRGALRYVAPLSQNKARFQAALRLDVDRIFPLSSGGLALRPRVALEPVAYLRFQRDETEAKERFLDFSELRGEIGVRLSPRFDFTPWFSWQNTYFIAQPQFNPDGSVKIPGGNGRIVQPVVGLDMRVTLGPRAKETERHQLPTQY
ncbi:hypothetical protein [Hymenobacter pini]|uniref:hypothetical protein n=1 Tax=Hymenobacter pini TaxID=2880879 RepID=UPI001CF26E1B|nr:hypothetical protein [Hymenobacter pini]MCA8831666.1 hypothetical protein [Hymenobacter pini]